MNCGDDRLSPISIEWPNGDKLFPTSAQFTYDAEEYDYFHCEFGLDAAKKIREKLDGFFKENAPMPVQVSVYGDPKRKMYFKPDFVSLGDDGGRLELHDLHEHLKHGFVEYAPNETTAKKTYQVIFDSRVDKGIFNGLEVKATGDIDYDVVDIETNDPTENIDLNLPRVGFSYPHKKDNWFDLEYNWAINFDNISPLKSIKKANSQFGTHSHISPYGDLIVGPYEGNNYYTASEEGHNSDFHISNASITNPSSVIQKLVVEGPKGEFFDGAVKNLDHLEERAEEALDWLNPFDNEKPVGLRTRVIVEDKSVEDGVVKETKNHDIKLQNIRSAGKRLFRAVVANRRSGNVTISNSTSNTNAVPGIADPIEIAEPYGCSLREAAAYSGGTYVSSGVSCDYDGTLSTTVDLYSGRDVGELDTKVRFVDISTGQTYKPQRFGYDL